MTVATLVAAPLAVRRCGRNTSPIAFVPATTHPDAMTDSTYLRDLVTLAAGVLLLVGVLTLSLAATAAPGAETAGAGAALLVAGLGILRAQNPRFPRRRTG